MAKLQDIEGIGASYAKKLSNAGVNSISALLNAAADKKGRNLLAQMTGVGEKIVLKWANRADLSRVKGIGTQYADLLEAAGVDTVPELAQRNAANLLAKMKSVNETKKLVRQIPGLSQVENWVSQAKTLPRKIHY